MLDCEKAKIRLLDEEIFPLSFRKATFLHCTKVAFDNASDSEKLTFLEESKKLASWNWNHRIKKLVWLTDGDSDLKSKILFHKQIFEKTTFTASIINHLELFPIK